MLGDHIGHLGLVHEVTAILSSTRTLKGGLRNCRSEEHSQGHHLPNKSKPDWVPGFYD